MNLRILLVLSVILTLSNAYKVLFLAPFNGKSHFLYTQTFVKALLNRGHAVTFLTSNSLKNNNLSNYTEYLIDPPLDMSTFRSQDDLFDNGNNPLKMIGLMSIFPRFFNEYHLKSAAVQKLIHSTGLHFDVIVMEDFFSENLMMFAHKFNAPIVKICPFGATDFNDRAMGLLTPSSFVPHYMLAYSEDMTFFQRWFNTIVIFYDWAFRTFVYLPSEEAFAKEHFAHLKPLPSMDELFQKVSIILVNTHRALSPPRPSMPSIINIGGAHLKPVKPLPKDLQTFLDESKDGVIYFSLGTVVQSSKLPKEKLQVFLDSFKNLKQRVLWKFEDESLTGVPPNVMIKKWMPQNDILAHPNVVLFISHGGSFGTSESLYHGVPLLIIPFFGDQHRNAHRIATVGNGNFLIFNELTTDTLSATLTQILTSDSIPIKAKEISAIFKDNLVHPMEEAMFWIEHVAKFKGAKHIQSHAIHMSWFSYLLIDVFIVTAIAVSAILFTIYWLIKKLFSRKKAKQQSQKKQN
ncbi:UDP-glucuronosyltransferase 2B16-like [Contarinia nasturtii]|uniref:UDP-glucuronosyltransferase 2B16-like n=1 Tax=Contarinia nasturtii TaxID=265458 RepID=UPI0012D46B54|nr:UDP-glucuronosyltransferase 2B16-like [Contarinia nasturtii]